MTGKKEQRPKLRMEAGPGVGAMVELRTGRCLIGRAEDCDLVVDDTKVSRRHAEISMEAQRWFLADLGSRNGTFLNGERVGGERKPLSTGDEIQLGAVAVLRFEDPATTVTDVPAVIRSQGVWLDAARQEVYVHYHRLEPPLQGKLFRLLDILTQHAGESTSKEQIVGYVWPEAAGSVTDQMLDTLVTRLRRRLAAVDPQHQYLVRQRGRGVTFVQRG